MYAKIGHTMISETDMISAYETEIKEDMNDFNFVIADTPGFNDTRGPE